MSHKGEKFSFLFYMADRLGGPVVSATLVACLLSGRMAASHIALLSAGVALFVLSYFHNTRNH